MSEEKIQENINIFMGIRFQEYFLNCPGISGNAWVFPNFLGNSKNSSIA